MRDCGKLLQSFPVLQEAWAQRGALANLKEKFAHDKRGKPPLNWTSCLHVWVMKLMRIPVNKVGRALWVNASWKHHLRVNPGRKLDWGEIRTLLWTTRTES